jgi:hypothetical protein
LSPPNIGQLCRGDRDDEAAGHIARSKVDRETTASLEKCRRMRVY